MEVSIEISKAQIFTLEKDDILNYINQLETRDLNYKDEPNSMIIAFHVYKIPIGPKGPDAYDIASVDAVCYRRKRLLNELKFRTKELGISNDESKDFDGNPYSINARIDRLIEQYVDAFEAILHHTRIMQRINTPMCVPTSLEIDGCSTRYSTDDKEDDKKSNWQELLLYLLDQLKLKRYKRYKDQCFTEIKTSDGKHTRAWKPVMDISEFVYASTQKEWQYNMWKNLTSKGSTVKDTVNYLSTTIDIQFPDIKKNRSVWSFQNGIFLGKHLEGTEYVSKFYEYDSPEFDRLDPTIVACKYFDQEFIDQSSIGDWYDIPTPHMQCIMDYQRFTDDVCRWLYVFVGRLCYEVNEMDAWQIIPFLKGLAGSGKSTIITKVCKKFYDPDDVKALSNNVEKKFGLESIHDCFLFISPEIKGDMALEQAEFQSLVSGEDMSIARKNLKAKSITWKVPGILAGNEMPGWKDNSGSILRRILVWAFPRKVMDADPQLEHKLDKELPMILQKCVRGYLDYSQKYKTQDIWNVVPPYFKEISNQVAMVTSVLINFLSSPKVRLGQALKVPVDFFVHTLQEHCTANGFSKVKFTTDFYAGPFSSMEIEVKNYSGIFDGRAYNNHPFIFGLEIVVDTSKPEYSTDN